MLENLTKWLSRNITQIKEGGYPVLEGKLRHSLWETFWDLSSLLPVILIRILRPLIVIRICQIGVDRIGRPYPALWYLSESYDGKHKSSFDIFYFFPLTPVSNQQWVKMLKRTLRVFPFRNLAFSVDKLNNKLPGNESHIITYSHPPANETLESVFSYTHPLFEFTTEEEELGKRMLRNLGIPDEASFICFHTRDSDYLDKHLPGVDWSYHDYRDTSIVNYVPSVEKLVGPKLFAIRLGSFVNEKLETTNPAIIDYATNGKRSEFLDIYLGARCRYFVGTATGMTIIPEAFKRPIVFVNWAAVGALPIYYQNGIIIMKKWYLINNQRYLTFREIFDSGISVHPTAIQTEKRGIMLADNTPDEIMDAMSDNFGNFMVIIGSTTPPTIIQIE